MSTTIMHAGSYANTPLPKIILYTRGELCHIDSPLNRKASFESGEPAAFSACGQAVACPATCTRETYKFAEDYTDPSSLE